MGHTVANRMDVVLNKEMFTELVHAKYGQYSDFWTKMVEQHPIGLQYKSFLNLIDNRVTWRLVYAWTVAEMLGVDIRELFVPVSVEVIPGERSVAEAEAATARSTASH